MGARLRFLGCGDAFGSGGRLQMCLHLGGADAPASDAAPGGGVLLECGATSLAALKRAGVDPGTIDWVLVSHLHADHVGGVPFLILDGQFGKRTRPLTIAGPPGLADRVHAAMEAGFAGSTAVARRFEVRFVELADRAPARVGPAVVTPFTVVHPSGGPPYALRVEYGGRVVTYSGDTEWTDALVDAADGSDLFVCEGYQVDRPVRFHLDVATVMRHRARLRCRRLAFVHLSAAALARRAELPGDVPDEGDVLDV